METHTNALWSLDSQLKYQRHLPKLHRKKLTEMLSPELLEPYNACRLIPLDKNSGVRPIGTGDVIRRKTGRTITKCLKSEFINYALAKSVASNMQFIRLGLEKTDFDAVIVMHAKML